MPITILRARKIASNALVVASNASDNWPRGGSGVLVCNGVDDHVQLKIAIDDGGPVQLSDGLFLSDSLDPSDDVFLKGAGLRKTTIRAQTAGINLIENATDLSLKGFQIEDLTLDGNSGSIANVTGLVLNSAQDCSFDKLRIINCANKPALHIRVKNSGDDLNRNNRFGHLVIDNADVGIKFEGFSASKVVTIVFFETTFMDNIQSTGISFNQFCNNNYFTNTIIELAANNATCVIYNEATPGSNLGIFGNCFGRLHITSFGGLTGTTGILVNHSKQNVIEFLTAHGWALKDPIVTTTSDMQSLKINSIANWDLDVTLQSVKFGAITDPGDGNAIVVSSSGYVSLTSGGSGETRTIADAEFPNDTIDIYFKTDGGGDIVITAASPINQNGDTIMTFSDIGEHIRLTSIEDGGDLEWRVLANDGVVLS